MELRIMTFNLRYDEPADGINAWPRRIGKAAETIARSGPALIGTQEGLHHMLLELGERLPSYGRIGEGREGGTCGEYNAIWYDKEALEVLEQGQFWLSERPDGPGGPGWDGACPRICTWGRFRTRREPGTELLFFNTHLDHQGQRARENGIALILRKIRQMREKVATATEGDARPLPVVLTGDFNASPDNPAVRAAADGLTEAFASLGASAGATYHGFKGGEAGEPIDYVFVSRDVRVIAAEVVREPIGGGYPSDHYPVCANIAIGHAGEAGRMP